MMEYLQGRFLMQLFSVIPYDQYPIKNGEYILVEVFILFSDVSPARQQKRESDNVRKVQR